MSISNVRFPLRLDAPIQDPFREPFLAASLLKGTLFAASSDIDSLVWLIAVLDNEHKSRNL